MGPSQMTLRNFIGNISKYIKYSKRLIVNFDVIVIVIISHTSSKIISDKVARLNQDRLDKFGRTPAFLKRIDDEINHRRISSDIDRTMIRSIFFSNLNQSRKLYDLAIHSAMLDGGFTILNVPTRGDLVQVRLFYNKRPHLEEGDFNISLVANESILHFITFSFCEATFLNFTNSAIIVGGNQGSKPETISHRRRIVRECFDISLEKILFLSLLGIAREFGYSHIVGVSHLNHSQRLKGADKHQQLTPNLFKTYDKFWISQGASLLNNYYVLDVNISAISSGAPKGDHKRRKNRKRKIQQNIVKTVQETITSLVNN